MTFLLYKVFSALMLSKKIYLTYLFRESVKKMKKLKEPIKIAENTFQVYEYLKSEEIAILDYEICLLCSNTKTKEKIKLNFIHI